ncbi:hypothetical protein [Anaerobacillus arseniciselenatis]|nr:hypothetical protein [Anaerobacillus arseniciselenatis]
MKIIITLLILIAVIMVGAGVKKQNRKMITISGISTFALLLLYMFLFRF